LELPGRPDCHVVCGIAAHSYYASLRADKSGRNDGGAGRNDGGAKAPPSPYSSVTLRVPPSLPKGGKAHGRIT